MTIASEYRHVMPMIVQLIHNPASGTHHNVRLDILTQAFAACGAQVRSAQTNSDGSVSIDPSCDLICVSGGDGTLRLVIAAMVENQSFPPLCVFPAGTVNLAAREIGYSSNPEEFAREVMAGFAAGKEARLGTPVIRADGAPFVASLSAGPDGETVARHSPAVKNRFGRTAYGLSFVKLLLDWPRNNYRLSVKSLDGQDVELNAEAFYIAKGHYFAGPWTLASDACLENDHFYLLALSRANRRSYLMFMLRLALGRDLAKLSFIHKVAARGLAITCASDGVSAFQIDGDSMEAIPQSVRMTEHIIEYCLPKA